MITMTLLENMAVNEVEHADDGSTYVVRTAHGFAVCDNGEEVFCATAQEAAQIVAENVAANTSAEELAKQVRGEETMIKNLTPHSLEVCNEKGGLVASIPPSGQIARVAISKERVGDDSGIPLFRTVAGDVTGLPEQHDGVMLVVSGFVRTAFPERDDLWQPGELLRDENGRVVGCVGLSQ